MSRLEDRVLEELEIYYSNNNLKLDQWVGPFELYPDFWKQAQERRALYRLASEGTIEERTGSHDLHYAVRLRTKKLQLVGSQNDDVQ